MNKAAQAHNRFIEVQQAYHVLSDPERRTIIGAQLRPPVLIFTTEFGHDIFTVIYTFN
jgi:DnaJ-class molecular chaperone